MHWKSRTYPFLKRRRLGLADNDTFIADRICANNKFTVKIMLDVYNRILMNDELPVDPIK